MLQTGRFAKDITLLRPFPCCRLLSCLQNYETSNAVTTKPKNVPMTTRKFDQTVVHPYLLGSPGSPKRIFSTIPEKCEELDSVSFERICEETLDSLTDYFEELVEQAAHLQSADVSYGSGVLTVNFGEPYGTYVINRQSPNKQIWLSSPLSGPKRYDYVIKGGYWIYKHDSKSLHDILQTEISDIVKSGVDFSRCLHAKIN